MTAWRSRAVESPRAVAPAAGGGRRANSSARSPRGIGDRCLLELAAVQHQLQQARRQPALAGRHRDCSAGLEQLAALAARGGPGPGPGRPRPAPAPAAARRRPAASGTAGRPGGAPRPWSAVSNVVPPPLAGLGLGGAPMPPARTAGRACPRAWRSTRPRRCTCSRTEPLPDITMATLASGMSTPSFSTREVAMARVAPARRSRPGSRCARAPWSCG